MVTGTSVLGLTFSDGVMLAADTLGELLTDTQYTTLVTNKCSLINKSF